MDFEERIERGADAEKWKGAKEKDELPLWVADMDFACSDAITAALHARADERIYGYTSALIMSVTSVGAFRWRISSFHRASSRRSRS